MAIAEGTIATENLYALKWMPRPAAIVGNVR